jgi:RHS repeat-associated protein
VVTLLSCPLALGQGTPQESSISPEAGDTYPWEAGLQVSTYTRVNLFNGNALTTIPIVSWPAFGPDMDFRLYHNSSAVGSGERAPAPGYGDPPGAPPQASTRYGFAGAWGYHHDALTSGTSAPAGLLHVGYRWYSPSIGRFIQRDPIGLQGGLNAYAYVHNDPAGSVDPHGLSEFTLPSTLVDARISAELVAVSAQAATNTAARGGVKLTMTFVEQATARQWVYDGIATARGVAVRRLCHWKGPPPHPPPPIGF